MPPLRGKKEAYLKMKKTFIFKTFMVFWFSDEHVAKTRLFNLNGVKLK